MKTIIVTGGARGLGAAIVDALSAKGYNVVINYNESKELAEKKAQELGEDKAIAYKADVRNREEVDQMVEAAIEKFGRIDGIVNNALIGFKFDPVAQKAFKDLDWEDYEQQLEGTMKAAFNVSQSVIEHFIEQKSGSIVNIGTNLFQNPVVPYHEYTSAKAGLLGMTRNIASELGQHGIRANMVSGGLLKTTDASSVTTDEVFDLIANNTPLRQVTTPNDVANMVAFLSSDEAKSVTGQNITVDGGLTMN